MAEKNYNQRYYKTNREDILKARRLKYLTDKEYRDKARLRSQVQTALISAQKKSMKKTVLHCGRVEPQLSLPDLLKAANRSKDVIYSWRRSKLLPMPSHVNNRGDGVYAESQIKLVETVFNFSDSGKVSISYRHLSKILFKFWKKTFSLKAVEQELKGAGNGKEDGGKKGGSSVVGGKGARTKGSGRRSKTGGSGASKEVLRHSSNVAGKSRNNSQYGQLRVSSTRGGSGIALQP